MTISTYRPAVVGEVGWRADANHVAWAALGGIVAAFATGIIMHPLGMLAMGPAALVGSSNVWVGWIVHLMAGVLFAAPYGLFVHTARYGKGALYGAVYGLVIGIVFAWLALFAILGMPLLGPMAAIDVILHVAWGAIVGLVSVVGVQRDEIGGTPRRIYSGTAP